MSHVGPFPSCGHECAVHRKVEPARIVGASPKKVSKEAREAFKGMKEAIAEFHEAARKGREGYKEPNRKGVRHQEHCLHDEPGVTVCTCEPIREGGSPQ